MSPSLKLGHQYYQFRSVTFFDFRCINNVALDIVFKKQVPSMFSYGLEELFFCVKRRNIDVEIKNANI